MVAGQDVPGDVRPRRRQRLGNGQQVRIDRRESVVRRPDEQHRPVGQPRREPQQIMSGRAIDGVGHQAGGTAVQDESQTAVLLDLGEHPAERVAHVLAGGEVEDSAVVLIQFKGNLVLNLEVTWVHLSERERQYVHALGTQGSGSLSPLKVYKDLDGGLVDVTPPVPQGRENAFTGSYRQQLAHFADAVRGDVPLETPVEQVTLLRILEAAYQSAERGEEIRLL